MFNVLDFIDSPDIREFNKDTKFTPAQQAVIIANSIKKSIYEKIDALEELVNIYSVEEFEDDSVAYSDVEWAAVDVVEVPKNFKEIVQQNIDMYKTILDDAKHNKAMLYITRAGNNDEIYNPYNSNIYSTFEEAYKEIADTIEAGPDTDGDPIEEFYYMIDAVLSKSEWDADKFIYDNKGNLIFVMPVSGNSRIKYQLDHSGFICLTRDMWYFDYLALPFKVGDIIKSNNPYSGNMEIGVIDKDFIKFRYHEVYTYNNASRYTDSEYCFDLWNCRYATEEEIDETGVGFELRLLSTCFKSDMLEKYGTHTIINYLNTANDYYKD